MAPRSRRQQQQSRRKRPAHASGRSVRPPLEQMSPGELHTWIVVTHAALEKKMARERAYLDRRAARGVCTPTDEAYEADQQLEADLVALLEEFEQHIAGVRDEPSPSEKRRTRACISR